MHKDEQADFAEIETAWGKAEGSLKVLQHDLLRQAQTAGEAVNLLIDSARILQSSLRILNKKIYDIIHEVKKHEKIFYSN